MQEQNRTVEEARRTWETLEDEDRVVDHRIALAVAATMTGDPVDVRFAHTSWIPPSDLRVLAAGLQFAGYVHPGTWSGLMTRTSLSERDLNHLEHLCADWTGLLERRHHQPRQTFPKVQQERLTTAAYETWASTLRVQGRRVSEHLAHWDVLPERDRAVFTHVADVTRSAVLAQNTLARYAAVRLLSDDLNALGQVLSCALNGKTQTFLKYADLTWEDLAQTLLTLETYQRDVILCS